ncbi:MAG TPA: hypothetical protein VGZ02_09240 [Candidatus Baltobacteraceae bacterium]|jgi:hypothetical protein|nr:hypothetical protein [Candidatus Baltobacteraceae bacterium]
MKSLRSALVLCIGAALAACGGNHGSSQLPVGDNVIPFGASSSGLATTTNGTLTFQITIPTNGIDRSYVSPATKGMALSWNGTGSGQRVFNLTHTNTNCVKTTKRVCTFKISFAAGSYHATFTLYDQAPSGGQIPFSANLLSSASNVPFTITSGQTKTIAPILLGVPAKLSVGPMPVACAAFPATPFAVTAFDADSHKIAGAYATAITLSDGDTSGATTIATSGYDKPPTDTLISSFDKATIAWNGNAIPGGSATIGAQAGSASVYASSVFTPQNATSGSASFNYAGSAQTFTVPACMTTIYVIADGAGAGSSNLFHQTAPGGFGGETGATIPTTPGESLSIFVGGMGDYAADTGAGGYNGGGAGAPDDPSQCGFNCFAGAGGGGGTDIRQGGGGLSNRVVVAGGGGGAGYCLTGGEGGGSSGGDGAGGIPPCGPRCPEGVNDPGGVGGGGGTQTAGGAGGGSNNSGVAGAGGAGQGWCVGGSEGPFDAGSGGGGGGWYGGGGGGTGAAGGPNGGASGGGGSAYAEPSATNVYENGGLLSNSGNGFLFICWGYSNQMCGGGSVKKLMARARHFNAPRIRPRDLKS